MPFELKEGEYIVQVQGHMTEVPFISNAICLAICVDGAEVCQESSRQCRSGLPPAVWKRATSTRLSDSATWKRATALSFPRAVWKRATASVRGIWCEAPRRPKTPNAPQVLHGIQLVCNTGRQSEWVGDQTKQKRVRLERLRPSALSCANPR